LVEIITGIERRRRWSAAEKLRIVAEMEQPGVGIAEVARRYEISRGLLWNWRSLVRRGVLRREPQAVFVPVQVISERPTAEPAERAELPAVIGRDAAVADSRIEITLPDGTSIRVGQEIGLTTLRRVVSVLRG
jgi:transposase-like protein